MKMKCKTSLRKFASVMLCGGLLVSILTIEAWAADLSVLLNLNAGAAEVIDSIDNMSMEEVTELATLDEETEAAKEEDKKEEYHIVMANVGKYLNVREQPDAGSNIVGYLYADCGGTILEKGEEWTKIQSGNLVGWANNEYLLFGEEAYKLAHELGFYEATVNVSGVRMRKEPNTNCGIWKGMKAGEAYKSIEEHSTDEWVAVEFGDNTGYISAELVTLEFTVDHGETLEEIKIREQQELRAKQQLIVQEGASYIGTTDEMLLAALIQCEAGSEPYEGQVAVGAVVMNRMRCEAYPNTIAGVIYASGQFSPARTGRIERLALNGVKESCIQAARAAMAGETTVGAAMHFRRVGNHEGIVIGNHVFW